MAQLESGKPHSLKEILDRSRDITMGLIYGYYDKELTPNHLQLCDGQQRLTTLFLILGVLNRKAGDDRYKDILISNFELEEDDKEPHLLYGIRESSLYFLSDLTIYYFLNSNLSLSDLDKQPWFLNSYNNDPTIISIKCAIETIEAKLASNDVLRHEQQTKRRRDICGHKHYRRAADSEPESKTADHQGE